MGLKDFLRECNDREVFKRLSIYIVSAWVILQVLVAIWEPLGLPEKSVTFLIILLLIGFPVYIYYLWATRVKQDMVAAFESDQDEFTNLSAFKRLYFSSFGLIGIVSVVAVMFIINNNFGQASLLPEINSTDKIAVLNFDNDTGNEQYDIVGKMTADWLIHGITEHSSGKVITSEVMKNYSSLMGTQLPNAKTQIITDLFQPSKIIKGAYFLNGKTLVINCSIQSGNGEVQIAFSPVECDVENSMECIENLKQEVVGYLLSDADKELNLEEDPPKFEAYEKLLMAKESYGQPDVYLKLLNETIALDSNYFEPRVLRVQHYYNLGEFKTSDSLIEELDVNAKVSNRQKYLLNFCKGLLEGKSDKLYRNFKHEYEITPEHLPTNSTNMVLLLQFLNKPELLEDVYNEIDIKEMNIEDDIHHSYRFFTMGLAYNEMGEFIKTKNLLDSLVKILDYNFLKRPLVRAYVNLNEEKAINSLITKMELSDDIKGALDLRINAAISHLLIEQDSLAYNYLDEVINAREATDLQLAKAYYLKKDYKNSEKTYRKLYESDENSVNFISGLACSLAGNGKLEEASEVIGKLEKLRGPYRYGDIEYAYAQYYSVLGDKDKALNSLLKSIAKGNRYYPENFQNDPHFRDYLNTPIFQEILRFWH